MSEFNIIGESIYLLSIKFFLGAVAAFLAIMLWRKTRTPAEILFILGILALYVSVLYKALQFFGFFVFNNFTIGGMEPLTAFFDILPVIFFIISLVLFLRNR